MTICTEDALDHILGLYRFNRYKGIDKPVAYRVATVEHAKVYGLTVMEARARLDFVLLNKRKLIMGVLH